MSGSGHQNSTDVNLLIKAVGQQDYTLIKRFLKQGGDVNTLIKFEKYRKPTTLLQNSIERGAKKEFIFLMSLKKHIDIHTREFEESHEFGKQAIHVAAGVEDVFYLHTLVQANADVNALSKWMHISSSPFDIALDCSRDSDFDSLDSDFDFLNHMLILLSCGANIANLKAPHNPYTWNGVIEKYPGNIEHFHKWEKLTFRVERWVNGLDKVKEYFKNIFDDENLELTLVGFVYSNVQTLEKIHRFK